MRKVDYSDGGIDIHLNDRSVRIIAHYKDVGYQSIEGDFSGSMMSYYQAAISGEWIENLHNILMQELYDREHPLEAMAWRFYRPAESLLPWWESIKQAPQTPYGFHLRGYHGVEYDR